MRNSTFFKYLENRLSQLKKRFLLKKILVNRTGNYTNSESDYISAYIVFAHAEIEAYFERIAYQICQDTLDIWNTRKKATKALIALMAHENLNLSNELSINNYPDTDGNIAKCINLYQGTSLFKNNGIKKNNILPIILPLGLDKSLIDETWLNTMDSFGETRGNFAHKSASKSHTFIRQQINPNDVYNDIEYIKSGIKMLDEHLWKLKEPL